ncbi:MAG: hypothetical protein FWE78_04305, partial [Methanimicrococcus sp.]|nr:hypothetical protein [Methanimicrococcus sp.]
MNFNIYLYNQVYVYITNTTDGEKLCDDMFIGSRYQETFITKDFTPGTTNTLDPNYTDTDITWTTNIGNGREILNGKTVTDTYMLGITGLMGTPGQQLRVTLRDIDNKIIPSYNNISVAPTTSSGSGFTYQIPNPGTDVYYVEITYKTSISNDTGWSYSNKASIDLPNDPSFTRTRTKPLKDLNITKTDKLISETREMEYTIVCNVPGAMKGELLHISDRQFRAVYPHPATGVATNANFGTMTYGTIVKDFEVKVKVGDEPEITLLKDTDFTYSTSAGAGRMDIYFITDKGLGTSPTNSYFSYDENTIITITYKISLDTIVQGETFEHWIKQSYKDLPAGRLGGMTNSYAYVLYGPKATQDFIGTGAIQHYYPVQKYGLWRDNNNEIIEYRVRLDLRNTDARSQTLFTDTFDSKMTLVDDTVYLVSLGAPTQINNPGAFPGAYVYGNTAANVTKLNGSQVTSTATTFSVDLASYAVESRVYELVYRMKVTDTTDLELGETLLTNTATIKLNGQDYSKDFSIVYGVDPVTKAMTFAGNTATATIYINPQALALTSDGSGKYTVTDNMSPSLVFYFSTIQLDAETSPGSGTWVGLTEGIDYTLIKEDEQTIILIVPDNKSLRLSYKALVKGAVGSQVPYSNSVSILGDDYQSYVSGNCTIDTVGGGAGGTSQTSFTLNKLDEEDYTPLGGAQFALYVDWDYPGAHPAPPTGVPATQTFGSKTFYYVGVGTTAADGTRIFGGSNGIIRNQYRIYAFYELAAPSGYILPVGDDAVTFFSFEDIDSTQLVAIGNPESERVLDQVAENVVIYNTMMTEYNITYVLNGGTNATDNPDTYYVEELPTSIGNPSKTWYRFTGWTVEYDSDFTSPSTLQSNYSIPIEAYGDLTLTANWEVDED